MITDERRSEIEGKPTGLERDYEKQGSRGEGRRAPEEMKMSDTTLIESSGVDMLFPPQSEYIYAALLVLFSLSYYSGTAMSHRYVGEKKSIVVAYSWKKYSFVRQCGILANLQHSQRRNTVWISYIPVRPFVRLC